jgi:small conductance mechanosensitive channel
MENFTINQHYIDLALTYGPKILMSIVILFAGLWLIKKITFTIEKGMERSGIDADLRPFLVSVLNALMKIFLFLGVANMVGIETTSIVAIIASAAFAVGLALQGTLSNFAAGIMILIFKPYRIGDQIEMATISGKVKEIGIFNTIVITTYNKIIIVPNSNAVNGIISNYTSEKMVKTNIRLPIRYNEEFGLIKNLILQILRGLPEVMQNPQPEISIESFEADGFIINIAAAILPEDLEDVSTEIKKQVYLALTDAGVKLGVGKIKAKQ